VPLGSFQFYAKRIENADTRACKTCGKTFAPFYAHWTDPHQEYWLFCSPRCQWARAPGIYKFTCPDGRVYVGGVGDLRRRAAKGIARSNRRLEEAFKQHPPETFVFEVLETLKSGFECAPGVLNEREQFHIERLQSWLPGRGFNMVPAMSGKAIAQRLKDALIAWDIRNAEGTWPSEKRAAQEDQILIPKTESDAAESDATFATKKDQKAHDKYFSRTGKASSSEGGDRRNAGPEGSRARKLGLHRLRLQHGTETAQSH
jgi:hypothetical protein